MIPTPVKAIILLLFGIFGVWLMYWNIVDWATQGLNTGVWDFALVQVGYPSIFVGFCIVVICAVLGVKVLKS